MATVTERRDMAYAIKAAKCTVCGAKVTKRKFFYGDEPFCSEECKHPKRVRIWTRAAERGTVMQVALADWALRKTYEEEIHE